MRETVDVRRRRILAAVDARGTARVAQLAAELGVSLVTVRRDVEELERAGRLSRGHGVARSLNSPGTQAPPAGAAEPGGGAVAVVVPERHSYLYEALHGVRTALEAAGMRITLHIAPPAAGSERPLAERALADGARGLIIAPRWRSTAAEEADYGWLAAVGVPTVLMERRPRPGSVLHAVDSVCSDHWYGVHLALGHLVALGHRRIVLAARDDSPTARAIRAAFGRIATERPEVEDWTAVLSSPSATAEHADGAPDTGGGAPELAAVLRERRATAALLHGDVDSLMLVQRLSERGVRVPEDCSVVAYDDGVAALASTPLTAVAPPKAELGRAAAELLLRRLAEPRDAPGPVRRLELLPVLKERGSVAPAGSGAGPQLTD